MLMLAVVAFLSPAGSAFGGGHGLPPDLRARLDKVEKEARAHPRAALSTPAGRLLRAIVAGLPPRSVDEARLALPPPGSSGPGIPGQIGHSWLYLRMRTHGRDAYQERVSQWQGELIAGAFRQASHDLGLDGIRGVSTALVYPNGKTSDTSMHVLVADFGLPAQDPQAMRRRISSRVAQDARFLDARIAFVHAYGAVPIVKLRYRPNVAIRAVAALSSVFGDPADYEGVLLEVEDASGRTVRLAARATGAGVGFRIDP
jgi:hypothetical protein